MEKALLDNGPIQCGNYITRCDDVLQSPVTDYVSFFGLSRKPHTPGVRFFSVWLHFAARWRHTAYSLNYAGTVSHDSRPVV
jgi:hypothetical protein